VATKTDFTEEECDLAHVHGTGFGLALGAAQ
jgi:hypothetical protein